MSIKCKHAALVINIVAVLNNLGERTYRDGDMGFGDPQPLERYLEYPEANMMILVWCCGEEINRADLYLTTWEEVREELVRAYEECHTDIKEIGPIFASVSSLCTEDA